MKKIKKSKTNIKKQGMDMKTLEAALNEVKPALMADGGNVELVSAKNGIVEVHLTGACAGCPMSQLTLKSYIETLLKEKVKGVKEVKSV